jgi:hypothetical protein
MIIYSFSTKYKDQQLLHNQIKKPIPSRTIAKNRRKRGSPRNLIGQPAKVVAPILNNTP